VDVKRREFITVLGGAAALPFSAHAQEPNRIYRLGFLVPLARDAPAMTAFFDELQRSGFVEGRNLAVIGSFNVSPDQIADGVSRVVKAAPDVIVSGPEIYAQALQAATRTIPVNSMGEDLVGAGLAASLAKPGGNIVGISLLSPELDGKRQDILIEAVPGARHMATLADATITSQHHLQVLHDAALSRGVELSFLPVSKAEEIAPAINEAKSRGAEAVNVLATPMFFFNRRSVIDRLIAVRLPAIYQWPDMAEDGGLIGYGPRFGLIYRQRALQIIKLLMVSNQMIFPSSSRRDSNWSST